MRAQARRGQPLVALALVLTGWVAVRAAIWQPPIVLPEPGLAARSALVSPRRAAMPAAATQSGTTAVQLDIAPPAVPTGWPLAPLPVALRGASPAIAPPVPQLRAMPVRIAAGHQLLWLAALAQLPLPPEMALLSATTSNRGAVPFPYRARQADQRWSADGWILWRRGGNANASSGLAPASYGTSQAGAVIRYRLAPGSAHRPTLYVRASTALRSPREEEVAAGFVVRPLAGIPVIASAELRATRLASGETLRPALSLVTEFPSLRLPLGARAEIYGQAGYVGGKGATSFVDGQLRIDRPLVKMGRTEFRAGGGAWGGAQDGASRVDVGPSATLGTPLGSGSARLAIDWRFRVAGNATPVSGPAITLSAGF